MAHSKYCMIVTTTDSEENAALITRTLLEEKLAACIQQVRIKSAYRWQTRLVDADEIKLEIKTKRELFAMAKARIESLHIYDVPEVILLPIEEISDAYAHWIDEETMTPKRNDDIKNKAIS